jgi:hypothetical protein
MTHFSLGGQWLPWIQENWALLAAGYRVEAPPWLVPMPQSGFARQTFAAPTGQVADWTLSMTDESRVHVHEFADGRRVVHRDKHDPDQGLLNMLAHVTFESPYVAVVALTGLLVAASKGK